MSLAREKGYIYTSIRPHNIDHRIPLYVTYLPSNTGDGYITTAGG